MRAAVAFCVLALAGCTLQRGYVAIEPSAAADPDEFVLKPIAGFPADTAGCEEMPDGSCELRQPVASKAPASPAPRPIAPRPKTVQQATAATPVVIAAAVPTSPTIPVAASTPTPMPASKPVEDDRKTADVLTDAAIAALIVQASRETYYAAGKSCPCPYDMATNGRLCGPHSAYSRPSGASLRCYATDVTADQIVDYRAKLALR